MLSLERAASSEALSRQVYEQIRAAVLDGRLSPGMRLPSTRALAREAGCSRNTVMAGYEQLLAEGYLEGQPGSGTFVSPILPEEMLTARASPSTGGPSAKTAAPPKISRRGAELLALSLSGPALRRSAGHRRAFVPGLPENGLFPFSTWGKLVGRFWSNPPESALRHGDPAGQPALRAAIAEYLRVARGVKLAPEQVFVTSGAQQALDLAVRMLLDPGDEVWLEEPGYAGLRGPPLAAGARLVPVPLDGEGLVVAEGRRRAPNARLAVVAPAHHYPLGVTLSLTRRLELLDWARDAGAWIVEDDFDSEYHYASKPLASLQSLEPEDGRVLYLGSFSKVLFPSLRVGYLVVPRSLIDSFAKARAALDDHPALALQPALAGFISEGHFAAYVRRMRTLYAARQEALLDAARVYLDGLLEVSAQPGGLHLVARLHHDLSSRMDDREASHRADAHGIVAPALSANYFWASEASGTRGDRQGLLLGYAAVTDAEMPAAVRRLAAALEA